MSSTLLNVGQTYRTLGVRRDKMENLFPLIPHIYIAKRTTHLFPTSYIEVLATVTNRQKREGVSLHAAARVFWATRQAQHLLHDAQDRVRAMLDSQVHFSPKELMELLPVSKTTITQWHQYGVFGVVRYSVRPKRDDGLPLRTRILIPAADIRRVLVWKLPSTQKGFGLAHTPTNVHFGQ